MMRAAFATADVAVLGAGPAGLAAARAAAETGASVHLIDAQSSAGGQYWMQPAAALGGPRSAQTRAGAEAIAAVRAAGVTVHLDAEVWAVFPDLRIVAGTAEGSLEIAPRAIVVATGAHDRVPAFPGWTLPGVVTAGAAQRLAKLAGVPAGARVVVAGSGPFLPVVTRALRGAGATIAAYVEAQRPDAGLLAHLARYPERWREAAGLLRTVATAAERARFGWIVTDALGTDRVEGVRIAPLARDGSIDRTRAQTLGSIDALVVGWGFRPSIDVTSLLGCAHSYDEAAGGWRCDADADDGHTSVPHVFAAGEVTGVGGARPARLAGRLAGIAAAADAGRTRVPSAAELAGVRRRLARARAFVAPLNTRCAPPSAIDDLAADSTIVCRCESVTKREIVAACDEGATSVLGAKLWTRAGMGRCQGRMCAWTIARIAAPRDPARAGYNRPRIPIRPVALSTVATALETGVLIDP
jgi:NADPH-dependent 2,4-dienoyl-CoA reductase/sulfur reductase-like enzyme